MHPGGLPGLISGPLTALVLAIGLRKSADFPPGPPSPEPAGCYCSCPDCPVLPEWVPETWPEQPPCPACPSLELGWEEVAAVSVVCYLAQCVGGLLWAYAFGSSDGAE